jgi:hypothetical protein
VGLAFSAPPASASEMNAAPTRPLAAATAAKLARLAPPARAFAQEKGGAAPATDSRSFFQKPAGVAALVLMAAGVGFTLYSISHDRKPVKSPIR